MAGGDGFVDQKLTDFLRQELDKKDILKKFKAEMRAEVLEVIRLGEKSGINQAPKGDLESPTNLMNELILEYLDWMNFHHSSSVLSAESGRAKRSSREGLKEKFKADFKFDDELPLMYSIMMRLLKNK